MLYEDLPVREVWAEENDDPFKNYGEGYEDSMEEKLFNNIEEEEYEDNFQEK